MQEIKRLEAQARIASFFVGVFTLAFITVTTLAFGPGQYYIGGSIFYSVFAAFVIIAVTVYFSIRRVNLCGAIGEWQGRIKNFYECVYDDPNMSLEKVENDLKDLKVRDILKLGATKCLSNLAKTFAWHDMYEREISELAVGVPIHNVRVGEILPEVQKAANNVQRKKREFWDFREIAQMEFGLKAKDYTDFLTVEELREIEEMGRNQARVEFNK